MKNFKYTARDSSGIRKEGFRQATCTDDVISWLQGQNFTPINVAESVIEIKKEPLKTSRKRIKSSDLSSVFIQLSTMVAGGISITEALETVSSEIENAKLQEILRKILDDINKGKPFAESIRGCEKTFGSVACAIIMAGETSGNMADAMEKTATHFEMRDKLTGKVRGAVAYPIFVISFTILMVIGVMAFVIPRFRAMFNQLGSKLPAFTQAFIGFYDFVCHNLIYIIGLVVVFTTLAVYSYKKTHGGHYFFSRMFLGIPVIGKILKQSFISIFCSTMATLVSSGVPVLEVFNILSNISNNDIIKQAILKARERIIQGSNISQSILSAGFFPGLFVKMIQAGEESGSLSVVLSKTARYYERKVENTISIMSSMMEPVLIVTIGSIVSVILIALYLPIFSISAGGK